jgi:CRISPR-associated protein Cas5h
MEGIQFVVSGNWGHFKRPETNNNPLSHDLITKTALIGMIGAVLGKERDEMKLLFPQLSEDLLYGVTLLNPVKKVSWGFTSRTAFKPWQSGTPKYFEFLKDPKFKITLALKESRSEKLFSEFLRMIINSEAYYTPVLGWHNCPAELEFISKGQFGEIEEGLFETSGFIQSSPIHKINLLGTSFRVGFDKLPTHQDNDFWNQPQYYKEVMYPEADYTLAVEGKYYEYLNDNTKWWLI